MDFDLHKEGPVVGVFTDHRIHSTKYKFRQSLARTAVDQQYLVGVGRRGDDRFAQRVVTVEDTRMIKCVLEPLADEFYATKIDHESIFVRGIRTKGKPETPVVSVHESAMPGVHVLPMRKRNVVVDFRAGEHLDGGSAEITPYAV